MPPSAPAPPRRDSRAKLGRTRRLRAEYGPGAGAADAARHPAGDGAESSVAPSSDRVAASFSPHRTASRSEEHTSELQSRRDLVCRLLLEKKKGRRNASRPRPPPPSVRQLSPRARRDLDS